MLKTNEVEVWLTNEVVMRCGEMIVYACFFLPMRALFVLHLLWIIV